MGRQACIFLTPALFADRVTRCPYVQAELAEQFAKLVGILDLSTTVNASECEEARLEHAAHLHALIDMVVGAAHENRACLNELHATCEMARCDHPEESHSCTTYCAWLLRHSRGVAEPSGTNCAAGRPHNLGRLPSSSRGPVPGGVPRWRWHVQSRPRAMVAGARTGAKPRSRGPRAAARFSCCLPLTAPASQWPQGTTTHPAERAVRHTLQLAAPNLPFASPELTQAAQDWVVNASAFLQRSASRRNILHYNHVRCLRSARAQSFTGKLAPNTHQARIQNTQLRSARARATTPRRGVLRRPARALWGPAAIVSTCSIACRTQSNAVLDSLLSLLLLLIPSSVPTLGWHAPDHRAGLDIYPGGPWAFPKQRADCCKRSFGSDGAPPSRPTPPTRKSRAARATLREPRHHDHSSRHHSYCVALIHATLAAPLLFFALRSAADRSPATRMASAIAMAAAVRNSRRL